MTTALALVVDDSRMARHMLGKMLKEQGIAVDAVESGEEALGYLCDKKPTMIFMDHTMPGMDGFQALRAIKNDPLTAAIPIIMYTSKEGEVYESQARALGAVGVIPKTLKPLELAKVLEQQQLLPGQTPRPQTAIPATPHSNRSVSSNVVIMDNDLPPQDAITPIVASKPATNKAELHELEQRLQQLTEQLQGLNGAAEPQGKRSHNWLLYAALALCAVLIGGLLVNNSRLSHQVENLQTENNNSLKQTRQERAPNDNAAAPTRAPFAVASLAPETQAPAPAARQPALPLDRQSFPNARSPDLIARELNRQVRFLFGEKPFNDKLAETLTQIAEKLQANGIQAEISVRSHFGRFCTQLGDNGDLILPARGQTLGSCEMMDIDTLGDESLANEQTPGFNEFLQTFEAEFGDSVHLALSTAGDQKPLVRYPQQDPYLDAYRWNRFATRNQRVEITVLPQ